jgi:1-acyl-sn-glycerol-3-phosphate acyltransferase
MVRANRVVRRLASMAVRVFFRDVEVVGIERVPKDGPVLFVANHVNSLVDPALLLGCLPRAPSFLAKSTLWQNPIVKPFLNAAGAVPVYRRQDEGVDSSRNVETFERCYELLARGQSIALFPEGVSHDEPRLQPLRTGVARIALEAERRHGPIGLRIVPIGLVFDDKETFRSRALVLVGNPVTVEEATPGRKEADAADVHRLTDAVATGLFEVTPNYESWQQARLIERAAALFSRPVSRDTRRSRLAEVLPIAHAFRDIQSWLAKREPERLAQVVDDLRRYDRLLEAAGLRDEQVAATYPRSVIAWYLVRTLTQLVLWLPLAVIGTALNWLPYRLVGSVAARIAESKDTYATYKLFSAWFLFPLCWVVEAMLAFWLAGRGGAAVMALAAPSTGYAALRFHERRRDLAAEARAFVLLRSRRKGVDEITRRRHKLVRDVNDLVDRYLGSRGDRENPVAHPRE